MITLGVSYEFLDKMFRRLNELKNIRDRIQREQETQKSNRKIKLTRADYDRLAAEYNMANGAVIAVEYSIRDYISIHGNGDQL